MGATEDLMDVAEPTEKEVARQLGVGIAEYRGFLERCWQAQVGSLEAHLECEGDLHGLVADNQADDPATAAERAEMRAQPHCRTPFKGSVYSI
jgi:DNA-directed RNA polymerase specialized sigma subunit